MARNFMQTLAYPLGGGRRADPYSDWNQSLALRKTVEKFVERGSDDCKRSNKLALMCKDRIGDLLLVDSLHSKISGLCSIFRHPAYATGCRAN